MTKLPVSQDFHSIQGEGYHVGVPMHFVRVTGCNVGRFPNRVSPPKNISKELLVIQRDIPNHSICASYSGEQFICDTDYQRIVGRLTVEDIKRDTWEQHVCFTGGEPILYGIELVEMVPQLVDSGIQVNIETSGTVLIPKEISDIAWITCSPKYGFKEENVRHIDELKFVVSTDTTDEAMDMMEQLSQRVGEIRGGYTYLQPVNGISEVLTANVERCLALLRSHPDWRLSVQLHKLLNVE